MYIYATRRKWSILLGVFKSKSKAVAFWNSLSPYLRESVDALEVMDLEYDFVAVEYQDYTRGVNSFDFVPADEFQVPEEGVYFEVYHFDCDWNSSLEDLAPWDAGILE